MNIFAWNEDDPREIERGKLAFQEARRKNLRVLTWSGQVIDHFRPNLFEIHIEEETLDLAKSQSAFQIFNTEGDEIVVWSADDPFSVKEAAKRFEEHLAQGWEAYARSESGKTIKIWSFDPALEEISFSDVRSEEKFKTSLREFARTFKKAKVAPPLRAG